MPGPFISYVPPGVYTRTLFEPAVNPLLDTVRLPVFIGIGQETLLREDYELVRGSSALTDILITKEDVNEFFVLDETDPENVVLGAHTGAEKKFRVTHYPIVTGGGSGTATTDPTDVSVYVNGTKVTVASVDGANGYVILGSFPGASDDVRCTYYFSRTDTQVTDDVSDQADGSNTVFKVFNVPITDGSNGGITSTDVNDVTVKVNGTAVDVSEIDGDAGTVTLETAPGASDTVTVTYYFNTWQNTFDYLPEAPTEVVRVGITPGDSSYIEDTDFVVTEKEIHWGASYRIASGIHTSGAEYFDDTQVSVTLVDTMVYLDECASYTDPDTSEVSDTIVRLTYVPTMGNGRDTTLGPDTFNALTNGRIDVVTDRPDLITAYKGVDVVDAMQRSAVTVLKVDGANRLITLETALLPHEKIFATYHTNYLTDDTYTLKCVTAGGSGVGEYSITSDATGELVRHVGFMTKSGISQTLNWGTGSQSLVGAFHDGSGDPIREWVRLTINTEAARGATLQTSNEGPWLITASTDQFRVNGTTVVLTHSTPAVMTGTETENFDVSGLTLIVSISGGDEQTFTFLANGQTAAQVATLINLTATGFTAADDGAGAVELTTTGVGDDVSIVIGNGTANAVLGFTAEQEEVGANTPVATVAADLTAALGPAITAAVSGSNVVLTTAATGTAATLTIQTVAQDCYTELGFTVGQSDGGEAAYQTYLVESFSDSGFTTAEPDGSGTGTTTTGIVGQTFIDDVTGLRFTLLAPEGGGMYDDGGIIRLDVMNQITCDATDPVYGVLGAEVVVANTTDVEVDDTAVLETFDKGGNEPAIGDFYYISYRYAKEDYTSKIFTSFKDIVQEYGELDPANKLTLGMFLAISNGALLVAGKQVPLATDSFDASTTDYMTAIDELRKPIQRRFRPAVIVPLTTNQTVISFLKTHVAVQSSPRYRQERIGIFGFGEDTEPEDAQAYASSLRSERMWAVYPETAVIGITDELGVETEHIVTGEMLAAALAGSNVSPAYDVATPMTFRQIVGFKYLVREMDEVEKNQTAVAGITVLEDLDPNIRVRQAFTTNMTTSLTREPTVITIADFVQQTCRAALEQFIGVKFLGGVLGDIERVLKTTLRGLINAQIISKFSSVTAKVDPTDPTSVLVEVVYVPVFPLNYITITFSLRSR
jgi:hypothetical protein